MDLVLLIAFTESILYLEIALKRFTYSITYTITRELPGHLKTLQGPSVGVVLEYIDKHSYNRNFKAMNMHQTQGGYMLKDTF